MSAKKTIFYITFFVSCLLGPCVLCAQQNRTFFMASQLLRNQKYEQAYPLFKKLHEQKPSSFIYVEKATECLINLKKYNTALTFLQNVLKKNSYGGEGIIKLGEIYHIKGDTSLAYTAWNTLLQDRDQPLQLYLSMAKTMQRRRAFDHAVEVLNQAEKRFPNSILLARRQADVYIQAGSYQQGVRSYLSMLKQKPEQMQYVQSHLLNMKDDQLYDAAILEIDDFMAKLPPAHPSRPVLQQLELWLLLERNLDQRAFATAKQYEQQNTRPTYLMYTLGQRLLAARKFDLARQAYQYYNTAKEPSLRHQSIEQVANVYVRWADYLSDYNLSNYDRRDSLYQKAYDTYNQLITKAPNYSHINRVLVSQAELALNYLYDKAKAEKFTAMLQQRHDSTFAAKRNYLEGRIKLYEKDYKRARIAFSSSNKKARIGSLAQKTRYYLALTDFYAGDYEFADVQLNALERQHTSYFANDAVKLRVWIQEGLQADSTGHMLKPFAQAIESFSQGNGKQAFVALQVVLTYNGYNPLQDDALVALSSYLNPSFIPRAYALLDDYLKHHAGGSPLHERLLWERARIADQVISDKHLLPARGFKNQTEEAHAETSLNTHKSMLPTTQKQLVELYEEILLKFPQGFYARFARDRIKELQNKPL